MSRSDDEFIARAELPTYEPAGADRIGQVRYYSDGECWGWSSRGSFAVRHTEARGKRKFHRLEQETACPDAMEIASP